MLSDFRRNLRGAWNRATGGDVLSGGTAYQNYRETIEGLALEYGQPIERAALAFVILSPSNGLMPNLRGLATCLIAHRHGIPADAFNVTGFARWKARAMEALGGKVKPHHIKGPKITAFLDNILRPWTSDAVCVDGHMISIAAGHCMGMQEAQAYARTFGYTVVFRKVEREVQALAADVRLPPCSVQAILWTARKRERGILADQWPGNRPIAVEEIQPFQIEVPQC